MPTICAFFGIYIRMYYDDHSPPHFHAYYGGEMVLIEIETLRVISGDLNSRALTMVKEWAKIHRDALEDDWRLAGNHEPLMKIKPLE
jgi:hypothetical protein